MQVIRAPGWGMSWDDARYYGRRWCAHVGPWLIFIWQCSDAEMELYAEQQRKR